MANTAAQLLNYLGTQADLNYAIQQQIYWTDKYEKNQKYLNQQTKFDHITKHFVFRTVLFKYTFDYRKKLFIKGNLDEFNSMVG